MDEAPSQEIIELGLLVSGLLEHFRQNYQYHELITAELTARQILTRLGANKRIKLTFINENGTVYLSAPEFDFYMTLAMLIVGGSEIVRQALLMYGQGKNHDAH